MSVASAQAIIDNDWRSTYIRREDCIKDCRKCKADNCVYRRDEYKEELVNEKSTYRL